MSLLNNTKPAQTESKEAPVAAEGKKKHNNSEYQKRVREQTRENGKKVLDYLKSQKDVPADVLAAAEWLGREPGARSGGMKNTAFGKPVFYTIFGDTPKVGDKVTALDVFTKAKKGYGEMRQLMKKWKEKQNIVVELDEPTSSYVIKSGTIPAYQG